MLYQISMPSLIWLIVVIWCLFKAGFFLPFLSFLYFSSSSFLFFSKEWRSVGLELPPPACGGDSVVLCRILHSGEKLVGLFPGGMNCLMNFQSDELSDPLSG